MYKYMCVVSDNADKNVFYDTVAEIKKLYHDFSETPYEASSNSEIGQILNISYRSAEAAKVFIKYEYDKRNVVVFSEIYLSKYFKGKKVEGRSFRIRDNSDKEHEKALSFFFLIVNIIVSLAARKYVHDRGADVILSVVLAVIYIVAAYVIQNDKDISCFRIMAMQFGGHFTIPLTILSFTIVFINDNSVWLYFSIIGILYFKLVIPALIISGIAYAVLPLFEMADGEDSLKDKIFMIIKKIFDMSTCQGIVFCGINVILAVTAVFTDGFFGNKILELMVYFVLILIYTISAVTIKRKNDISLLKILFMQSGEYIALVIFIVFASIFSIGFDLNGTAEQIGGMPLYAFFLLVRFYEIVIPAIAISGIISSIILFIIKNYKLKREKISSTEISLKNKKGVDNYEPKNRYQTRN